METVSLEPQPPPPPQPIVKKRSPPRLEAMVTTSAPGTVQKGTSQGKPRRRRIRSELDRLLSDEGTRNMLRGLKKPNKKPSNAVFRTRVIEKVVGGGRGGTQGGRRVFRPPIIAVKRRRGSSSGRGSGREGNGGGGGSKARGGSVGRGSSPGKSSAAVGSRECFKIDYKYVNVSKRGGVGWVTIVNGDGGSVGSNVKVEESGDGEEKERGIVSSRILGGWGVKVLQSIDSAVRSLEQDTSISVIVLQNSHSRFFCNGIDLSELVSGGKGNVPGGGRISAVVKAMKSLILTLNSSRKLLVASVSGDCVGFGVMVLPLFDLVYANDKSSFRVHYNALGQSPEGVGLMGALLRGGGAGKISSLLYLNNSLTATEALQAGLIHEILWPARYQEELAVRLQSLSSQGNLICSSKSTIRVYRKNVKITELNSEFSALEEQWGKREFQDVAKSIVVAGDYEFVLRGRYGGASQGKVNGCNGK